MPETDEDISHYCGDSRTIIIPILDEDGAAVPLAGGSARWWMARSVDETLASHIYIMKATSGDGITITGPATVGGVANVYSLVIVLDPEDTKTLRPGIFYHEAEVTDISGNVSTVTTGAFTLKRDLVRT